MDKSQSSEQIGALAGALAKAQGSFKPITKSKTADIRSQKGNYSYNYFDLSDILDAVKESLAQNEIAAVQTFESSGNGAILSTRLIHSSGQWISSMLPIEIPAGRPQELGALMTFYRRYALAAILNIAADDVAPPPKGRGIDEPPLNINGKTKTTKSAPAPQPAKSTKAYNQTAPAPASPQSEKKLDPVEFCTAGEHKGRAWIEFTEDQLLNFKLKIQQAIEDPAKASHRADNESSLKGVQKALKWMLDAETGNPAFGA